MADNSIKITAEPVLDPGVCKFIVDRPILPGRSISCRRKEAASGAPLLESLFAIDGVREVLVADDCIIVARQLPGNEDWRRLGLKIGAAIRNLIESGAILIPDGYHADSPDPGDLSRRVEELLERKINPGIAAHGGHVELVEIKDMAVHLRMSGGCQGCGAASVTLKQGIERALRSAFPEIREVVDVSDHKAGKNPYYRPREFGSATDLEHGGDLIES